MEYKTELVKEVTLESDNKLFVHTATKCYEVPESDPEYYILKDSIEGIPKWRSFRLGMLVNEAWQVLAKKNITNIYLFMRMENLVLTDKPDITALQYTINQIKAVGNGDYNASKDTWQTLANQNNIPLTF